MRADLPGNRVLDSPHAGSIPAADVRHGGALLGLIALLATLQYKWLGRISDAEREHMRATLNTRASELTRGFR